MAKGTVKWFSDKGGYGFISPEEGGEDLFIHCTNMEGGGFRSLREGQVVEYEASSGQKGPEATDVRPA